MQKSHLLHITYFLGFFFGLHAFSLVYVNSSVLSAAAGVRSVGLIYTLAALLTIGTLAIIPKLLKRVGDRRFALCCLAIEALASFGLAMQPSPALIIVLFVIHYVTYRAVLVDMDIFLESATSEDVTGTVRGTFLSVANIALVVAPVMIGFLLGTTDAYNRVYLFASLILLPAILLLLFSFKQFRDPRYVQAPILATLKKVWAREELRRIAIIDWLLRFFYAWMVIYMPLYLHTVIGLPWERIGIVFTIMLLPFALIELPLGTLADRRTGEKELLIVGLFIMGAATLIIPFVQSSSFIIWTVVLFTTRLGAATVEIMSETYFFKQIQSTDADLIGFFRSVEPFAYVAAPLIATLALLLVPLPALFMILGFIVLCGIPVAAKLVDTR